jgi:hypothetical protein
MSGSDSDRQNLMQRDVLLMAIAGLSLVNGMHFSPYFDPAFLLLRPFAAGFLVSSPLVLLYLTSLFVSLLTLAVGGVPAALVERARAHATSTPGTLALWLAGVAIIALPTMLGLGFG